jgi:tetratricopeptide (TPR) repeat protein
VTALAALAAHWPEINSLLNEALALPVPERAGWLDSLHLEHAELKDTLRELLAAHAAVETGDFLGTLPRIGVAGSSDAATHEPTAGDVVGPYRLLSELGRGGMGAVWLADRADEQLKRPVALKLPRAAWSSSFAERLVRERDILATLEHPHIARLYDAGVDALGRPWLALEYVHGRPIDEYVKAEACDVRARIKLLVQVAQAVAYAHSRLVIHRDLKPNNILVDAQGQVRLLDFGIAKLVEGERTEETALTRAAGHVLTPEYASPEQVSGAPLMTSSDVYSLGVVAYELLAGCRPYRLKRGTLAELEEAIAQADAPRASEAAADTPTRKVLRGDLDAILNKALKKRPEERYATVVAFAEDLQRHLAQQPVLARPDRLGYRAGKFLRRYRLQVVAGGIAALSLLGGTGASLWQLQVARVQASRAEEVKKFVLSIFRDADSGAGGSRKTSAADLLKQARARLEAAPIADAAIRAEVLTSIGFSLIGLGEYAQAREALDDATRRAMAELGPQHAATCHAQLALGEVLVLQNDGRRAGPVLDAAEQCMRRLRDMSGLVKALRWQAQLRTVDGRFDEGIARAGEAVSLAETHLAQADKPALLDAYLTLSVAMATVRRPGSIEPARKAYELAHEVYRGRTTGNLLHARSVYAHALVQEGDALHGVGELKAIAALQAELFGPDNIYVKTTLERLSHASLALGDPLTAIDAYKEALRIARANDGDRATGDIALLQMNLGQALIHARRWMPAEEALHRAIELFTAAPDANPSYARLAQAESAVVLTQTGRLAEADAVFARLLQIPFGHPIEAAALRMRLANLRSAQGRSAEAVDLARQTVAFFAQARSETYARALATLGSVQLEGGSAGDARATLEEAAAFYARQHPRGSPIRAEVLVKLARTYLALDQAKEALTASEGAARFWRAFDPANREAGVAHVWHARALAAIGDAAKAADALREATGILATTGLPTDRNLLVQAQRALDASVRRNRPPT